MGLQLGFPGLVSKIGIAALLDSGCDGLSIVFCMGNLWVLLAVPIPVPVKTRTCATGTGFFMGQFFSYLYLTRTCTRGG
jgi:hypothetical protein